MAGSGRRAITPKSIKIAERNKKALELRKAGHTWADIATKCGFNNSPAAHIAVRKELEKLPREAAEELRIVQRERLEGMFLALYKQIKQGDHSAIDRGLRIMERQAKLDRLDLTPATEEDMSKAMVILAAKVASSDEWSASAIAQTEAEHAEETHDTDTISQS